MKLATIEVIESIIKHPNADQLEIAKVLNWECVIKKDKHYKGEIVVYVSIDTLVPNEPWSAFLYKKTDKKYNRIKISKIRDVASYGIIFPLTILPENMQNLKIGTDVSEVLNIKKYEKYVPSHLLGTTAGPFPDHLISQTDEINGLSDFNLVEKVLNMPVTITQKLDGSSGTVIINNGKITHVCSRRIDLKEDSDSVFWIAAKKINIPSGWTGCIQAETVGPGIQGNSLKLFEPEFRVFNIKKENGIFMKYKEMETFCKEVSLEPVPIVEYELTDINLNSLQEIADKQVLNNNDPAEGVVVRPTTYEIDIKSSRPLGFKILNRNYVD